MKMDKIIFDSATATGAITLSQMGEGVLMLGGIVLLVLRLILAIKELKK